MTTQTVTHYGSLVDRDLVRLLEAEDQAEDAGRLDPDHRLTCWTHRSWYRDCWRSDLHANPISGHNWCRDCDAPAAGCVHADGYLPD